jgi:hypothetical protein
LLDPLALKMRADSIEQFDDRSQHAPAWLHAPRLNDAEFF